MIYEMYSIRDTMTGFQQPMMMPNDNVAKRAFLHGLADTNEWPYTENYELYHVGTFDDQTGQIQPMMPELLAGGTDVVRKQG